MYKIDEKIITFLPWEDIEPDAQQQIINTSKVPCLFHHVAVMPDCHFGKGATVGTVVATKGAIIPAAVGVDIGCGMIAVMTNLKREQLKDLAQIRQGIERRIPMSAGKFNNKLTDSAQIRVNKLIKLANGRDFNLFDKHWELSLGTLGGGNHFIEICLDEKDNIWVTLHSGSRGVGNKIGNFYIKEAQKLMDRFFITLPDEDLAYIPELAPEFNWYISDLNWAQEFALANREEMMDRVLTELSYHIFGEDGHQKDFEVERINSHHNFAKIENHLGHNVWVTRKGAVEARLGMKAMIPGSMGAKSYIVSGLENPMSFNSSPHGAGRKMSRNKAREMFNMDDMDKAMVGIEFRKSEVLIDEIPSCYKDIDQVIENSKELVKVEHTLRQILNCKGD